MLSQSAQEEAKLIAMQRAWQGRRGLSAAALYEEATETEELLSLPLENSRADINQCASKSSSVQPPTYTCSDIDSDNEFVDPRELEEKPAYVPEKKRQPLILDASSIGDLPAVYRVTPLEKHQFPVVGVYVDKRVVPGFKYKVRPLGGIGAPSTANKCLFGGKALTLTSIGRGYARRFTFEADKNKLNDNDNYFWSDNRQEGYAFELEVISEGDKFTIFDLDGEAQGSVEVVKSDAPQIEISSANTREGIEKRAIIKFTGKVEFYETGVAKPLPLSGTAVCVKSKSSSTAEVVKVINVVIRKQRYCLRPGIQKIHRRVTVRGQDINDVPTKYTMNGLEPYEIPVVGTYVDPRIIPGFYYRVRPNDRKEHLFNGRALKLVSIGMGYAKRLTFEGDNKIENNNYLWSDNHPDGLGLEPRGIRKGMQFTIKAGDRIVGEATVFRADKPNMEEKMEKVATPSGKCAIVKYIYIDATCYITLANIDGDLTEAKGQLMRVCGLAVVRKEPDSNEANVIRVENIGLDSQLNILFAQNNTELTFYRKF